jgi:hypothetical protein
LSGFSDLSRSSDLSRFFWFFWFFRSTRTPLSSHGIWSVQPWLFIYWFRRVSHLWWDKTATAIYFGFLWGMSIYLTNKSDDLYALEESRLRFASCPPEARLTGDAKTGDMERATWKRIKATADQRMMFREVDYEWEMLVMYVMGGEVQLILRDDTWIRPYLRTYGMALSCMNYAISL